MSDFAKMLERSFKDRQCLGAEPRSRLEYLAEAVFDFTTYDSAAAELFATKALEVCSAISNGATFDYIRDTDNYQWYLLMVNMPFFAGKLDWGTSIRGAWWSYDEIEADCDLWNYGTMKFTHDEWIAFIADLVAFAEVEHAE